MSTVLVAHPSADLYGSDLQLVESVAGLVGAGRRVVVTLPAFASYSGTTIPVIVLSMVPALLLALVAALAPGDVLLMTDNAYATSRTLADGSEQHWTGTPPRRTVANLPDLLMRLACEGAGIVARPLAFQIPFRVFAVRPAHRPGNPLVARFQVALAAECAALGQAVVRAWGGGSRRPAG